MKLVSLTDIGCRRKDNQDNYWASIATVDGDDCGFICVCDGMGGLNDGGTASRMTVEAIKDGFITGVPFRELEGVIQSSNLDIFNLAQSKNQGRMGTTCTTLEVINGKYRLLHVGDSRCYKISRKGALDQLTQDHSAIKQYGITPESDYNRWKKYKNSLTRCVGAKSRVKVDYREGSYSKGDGFLVCSDGMWHLFEKECFRLEDLNNIKALINKAIGEGETDNITCCILWV